MSLDSTVENSIIKVTGEWINNHKDMYINFHGRQTKFSDYVLMLATNSFIKRLITEYNKTVNKYKQLARDEYEFYKEEAVVEEIGYTIDDINKQKIREKVYSILKSQENIYIETISKASYSELKPIIMSVRNNKKIVFTGEDLLQGTKIVASKISKFDPEFIPNIKDVISKTEEHTKIDYPTNNEIEIVKPRARLTYETDEEYERYLKDFYDGGSFKK